MAHVNHANGVIHAFDDNPCVGDLGGEILEQRLPGPLLHLIAVPAVLHTARADSRGIEQQHNRQETYSPFVTKQLCKRHLQYAKSIVLQLKLHVLYYVKVALCVYS